MLFLGAGAVLVGIVTIMYGLYDVLSMMYEENHRLIQVGVAFFGASCMLWVSVLSVEDCMHFP